MLQTLENKENMMNLDHFEAETARLHREYIEEGNCDTHRSRKEKRTVSDNSRPLDQQSKS